MERKVLLVSCVVGFLGLLSAATGFAAEATRIKGSQVQFRSTTQCVYPRSPAMILGLTASAALLVAHVVLNASTGCICCRRTHQPPNSNWKIALVCFIVSWFTFVIAFLLLLTGAALNDQHGLETMYFGNYYCYVVKPGVFAVGAFLSLVSVTLGVYYYHAVISVKNRNNVASWVGSGPNQGHPGGIAMGHPQFPVPPPPPHNAHSQSQDPVFVHEDTYNRRQFA